MQIKIALFGLGRTGKIVAQSLVRDEKFELVFAVSSQSKKKEEFDVPVKPPELISRLIDEFRPDVIVDFTTPDAVMSNINRLKDGTSYVIATTGFSKEQLQIIQKIDRLKILYAPNISDGINAVMKVCNLLNRIWGDTDVEIIEQHFKSKKDLPSGTALKLSEIFDQPAPIHSVRAGGITGVHEVILAGENQTITIRHESFNREVFAEGAKKAAIWLMEQECGFYEVHEVYS